MAVIFCGFPLVSGMLDFGWPHILNGFINGKRGAMLKEIGQQARADIVRMLDAKVFLELWVKVKEGWRNNQYQMRNFGYEDQ